MALDRTALESELARWLGAGAWLREAPLRLAGGQSAECYRVEIRDPPPETPSVLVLRLQNGDRAAARERAIQTAVAEAGFAAPRVFRAGDSASAFGRPYAIMAFAEGRDPIKDRLLRSMPAILADTMLRLHALDAQPARAALAAVGLSARDVGIPAVLDELLSSGDTGVTGAARWLSSQSPYPHADVICHGDLHGFNLLLDKGRVRAVLDWELATLAPREYDVARTETLFALMPGVGPRALSGALRWLGARAARQFVAAYVRRVPLDRDRLDFCRVLHALRLISIARGAGLAPAGVRRLWQPLEEVLARRWQRLTGRAV
jgi:aminoglycoside phosphotransferase (APT) family kinase protein